MGERRKPELLAPAGDMERLRMAVLYGADAVYLAGESFGMRSFAGNFSPEELKAAVELCRAHVLQLAGSDSECTVRQVGEPPESLTAPAEEASN